jgi:predicted glutamine amidotransferase
MSAGEEAVRATFWLLGARDSLRVQSHRNADGTGIGYFDPDGTPRVDKQPIAAFEDRRFATEARQICSRTFVAHVRHATNGALTTANTHPFCERDRLFAHNGVIGDVPKLEQHLGESLELVAGESDSERFFALITGEIDRHDGSVGAGISAAARWVVQTLPVVSINFVLVTATDMWALRNRYVGIALPGDKHAVCTRARSRWRQAWRCHSAGTGQQPRHPRAQRNRPRPGDSRGGQRADG